MQKWQVVLVVILVFVALLLYVRAGSDKAAVPVATSAEEPASAALPPDQLIAAATRRDATVALAAFRALERAGHCPYLPDAPETPIGMLAAAYGQPDADDEQVRATIRLLLRLGCDIDQYNASGLTPLHNAILFRQPGLLKFLLELGADPRLRVIAIPGRESGRDIVHLDIYGMAQVLHGKHPEDEALREILGQLEPST